MRIENLRVIRALELELSPGWNVFIGPNGAGKTTLVEAAYALSHGRSFRPGSKDALAGPLGDSYALHAKIAMGDRVVGLGLARRGSRLEARIDGLNRPLGEMVRQCVVACFEPGSHALIAGPADERRRFLDWGVFHVEHGFMPIWRRCKRALKQRNAALRQDGTQAEIDVWDEELALAAGELNRLRLEYFNALCPLISEALASLVPELGEPDLQFDQGWDEQLLLRDVLFARRETDFMRGVTTRGPHRADWSIAFDLAHRREQLSRGHEKLCALACILAQVRLHAARTGEWPILGLDDLASELDPRHQQQTIDTLRSWPVQVLLTGTGTPVGLESISPTTMFHVERGTVRALL
ncbi:MAG: DNA replication/repair protein RecF [Rhodanobacteraceae bacterium]